MTRKYTLYTYFRSSCSARVRIAAHLKSIPLEYKYIHLVKNQQSDTEYTSLNPSQSVPTLIISEVDSTSGNEKVIATIRQSIATLEYFEEAFPESTSLLPKTVEERAKVRELVNIIACDVQPVTNLRVLVKVKQAGVNGEEWQREFMAKGLRAYESLLADQGYAGKYSVGNEITLADVCLMPAVDNARRYGVDMTQFPVIVGISKGLEAVDAFVKGGWKSQGDTPDEFRIK